MENDKWCLQLSYINKHLFKALLWHRQSCLKSVQTTVMFGKPLLGHQWNQPRAFISEKERVYKELRTKTGWGCMLGSSIIRVSFPLKHMHDNIFKKTLENLLIVFHSGNTRCRQRILWFVQAQDAQHFEHLKIVYALFFFFLRSRSRTGSSESGV